MILIYPDYSEATASRLASNLGIEAIKVDTRFFPNGEVLARISDVDKIREHNKILIFFPTYPDTNNRLIMLLQTLEALSFYNEDAEKTLIQPYLSYSRQDKRFLEGEGLSLKLYLHLLCDLGLDHLIVFDVHSLESFKKHVCCKYTHITLYEELVKKILDIHSIKEREDAILVAPDKGRLGTIRYLSNKFTFDYVYLEKTRDRYTGDIKMKIPTNVDLRNYSFILLIDDEISTGGTMSLAAKYLKSMGARTIIASAIHLLLVSNADNKLFSNGIDYLYGTNTITNPYSIVYIEDIIPRKINW